MEIFLLSSCYWFLIWFHCAQRTNYDFQLFSMLFYSPRHNLCWYVSWSLAKKCVLYCIRIQCSRNTDYIMLADGVVFLYILVDISINFWERSVDISNYNCTFVYFFFHFYHFCFRYILWSSFFLMHIHLELLPLGVLTFFPQYMSSMPLIIFCILMSALSNINTVTTSFFWSVYIMYLFPFFLLQLVYIDIF